MGDGTFAAASRCRSDEPQQPRSGLVATTRTKPDRGEDSYVGKGLLTGKVALVTGGDSGVGRTVAIAYAREGAHVAISCLAVEQVDAEETRGWVGKAGRRCLLLPGDIRDRGTSSTPSTPACWVTPAAAGRWSRRAARPCGSTSIWRRSATTISAAPCPVPLPPRDGEAEDIRWLPLNSCFVFHTASAYDLPDGRVVLDVVAYDRMFAGDYLAPDEQPRGLERWTIDPETGTVDQRAIDPAPQGLPTIDERRTGLPYRHAYAFGLPEQTTETLVGEAPLIKHDLALRTRQLHAFGPGRGLG